MWALLFRTHHTNGSDPSGNCSAGWLLFRAKWQNRPDRKRDPPGAQSEFLEPCELVSPAVTMFTMPFAPAKRPGRSERPTVIRARNRFRNHARRSRRSDLAWNTSRSRASRAWSSGSCFHARRTPTMFVQSSANRHPRRLHLGPRVAFALYRKCGTIFSQMPITQSIEHVICRKKKQWNLMPRSPTRDDAKASTSTRSP
jgi:hypothetical protein